MKNKENIHIVKMCYDHIGGKFGGMLLHAFVNKGWIIRHKTERKHLQVTAAGLKGFKRLKIDISLLNNQNHEDH